MYLLFLSKDVLRSRLGNNKPFTYWNLILSSNFNSFFLIVFVKVIDIMHPSSVNPTNWIFKAIFLALFTVFSVFFKIKIS